MVRVQALNHENPGKDDPGMVVSTLSISMRSHFSQNPYNQSGEPPVAPRMDGANL